MKLLFYSEYILRKNDNCCIYNTDRRSWRLALKSGSSFKFSTQGTNPFFPEPLFNAVSVKLMTTAQCGSRPRSNVIKTNGTYSLV